MRIGSVIGVCLLLATTNAVAQQSAPVPAPAGGSAPGYKSPRYEEDYRYLADPARRGDLWDPIKYIPLGSNPSTYLSFGGEIRERGEYFSAPQFGLRGDGADAYLLHRLLLHGDLHVGDDFRAFVQLGNHLVAGKDSPLSQTDRNRLDLQQALVDVRLPITSEIDPTLRAGRQEMAFGSQRLVSVRESPNIRRSFDGFRLGDTIGGVRLDAFATRPVLLKEGIFDDEPNHSQAFWGVYGTTPAWFSPGGGLDLYYLGFDNSDARFSTARGGEHRHTVGARLFGASGGWDWDWEAAGQVGSFAGGDIRAWTVASNTGFTFAGLPWQPRAGLKANIASGDDDPRDRTLGTFNALFPKLAYFNEASLIVPANFFDVYPTITVKPLDSLAITVGWDFIWRETTQDAVYTNPLVPIAGTAGQGGKFIGDQVSLDVVWQVDRHIQIYGSYVHASAGNALAPVHGRDVDFAMLSVGYRF